MQCDFLMNVMNAGHDKFDKEAPDDAAPMHFPGLPPRAGAARARARPVTQESERAAGKASQKTLVLRKQERTGIGIPCSFVVMSSRTNHCLVRENRTGGSLCL